MDVCVAVQLIDLHVACGIYGSIHGQYQAAVIPEQRSCVTTEGVASASDLYGTLCAEARRVSRCCTLEAAIGEHYAAGSGRVAYV